jgi:hypothetical protein
MADWADRMLHESSVVIACRRGRLDLGQGVLPSEPLLLPWVALDELYRGALTGGRDVSWPHVTASPAPYFTGASRPEAFIQSATRSGQVVTSLSVRRRP